MKAVVLVGGEGTRLRPLTYATPKPLLPIVNQPFLERQLTWLASYGIDEVVLSLGYLPDAFERRLPGARFGDLALRYVVEDHPLGTAGAIRFAAEGIDERVIVCNGDVLTTLDLDALVQFHEARGAEATIHLTEVGDPSAYGVVPTSDDGEVVAFVEKPPPGKAPTSWINAGTYVLEPSVLERIPERLPVSIERETFPRMLDEPGRLFAMASTDYWIDIGTPEKYLEAHRDVLGGALGTPPAPGALEREPGIWVQGRSTVDVRARLEAPSLIGESVVVGSDAWVAGSVVGPGCRLGAASRVVRSVLLEDVRLEPGAEVVDSIIGAGATIGATACVYDHSIVGPDVQFPDGGRASGARIAEPMMEKGD
jgi:mannose-1-phosphate guanylyltransferase